MPRRILIVRLSAIGDTIYTLPLAAALRRAWPDAHLGWLVEEPASPLVVRNPLLDWWRVLPKGWLKKPAEVWRLRRDLRDQRFDTVLDPQGLSKSAVAAWLTGAKQRVGFVRDEAREIAPLLNNHLVATSERQVTKIALSLLAGVGLAPSPADPELVLPPLPEEDRAAVEEALTGAGIVGAEGFYLFSPWASTVSKCWPVERFAQLARRLYDATGKPALALGHGTAQREAVWRAGAEIGAGAMRLAPEVSVLGVFALARRAAMFVGSDSFPLHAAAGLGMPTLGLFGVTDPGRFGPHLPGGVSLYATLTLARSHRARKRLDQANMLALSVDRVAETCLRMLAPKTPAPPHEDTDA